MDKRELIRQWQFEARLKQEEIRKEFEKYKPCLMPEDEDIKQRLNIII